MRRSSSRSFSLVSLLAASLAASIVLGACGNRAGASQIVAASSSKTAADGTSAIALTFAFEGLPGGKPVAVTAEGAFDYTARKGRLVVDVGSVGLPGVATGTKAEMLLDGDVVFMKFPGVGLPDKPWVRVDAAERAASGAAGSPIGGLDQLGSSDPTAALDMLRGVAKDVREIGEEKVRGTTTTRYRGTVDLKAALAKVPENRRAQLDALAEQLEAESIPVDVWVDGDGRARRLVYAVALPGPDGGASTGAADDTGAELKMTTTIEFFDFGTKVDLKLPPAEQIVDPASMQPSGTPPPQP